MSLPTEPEDKSSLSVLDKNPKFATVYVAYLESKTPQEAIRFIYNLKKGESIPHNTEWIIKTRRSLTTLQFVKNLDPAAGRDIPFQSNIEPIIEYLTDKKTEGSENPVITNALRIILESQWFRGFFSDDLINTNPITYINGAVYKPYSEIKKKYTDENDENAQAKISPKATPDTKFLRNKKNREKLDVHDFSNRLSQILSEIGYYSHNFQWTYYHHVIGWENRKTYDGETLLQNLLNVGDFDLYCSMNSGTVHPEFVRVFCNCLEGSHLRSVKNAYPAKLFAYLFKNHAGMFIPEPVSILLRSIPYTTSVQPVDCGLARKEFIGKWRNEINEK